MANRNFEPRLAKLERLYPARERVEVFIRPEQDTPPGIREAVRRELAELDIGIDRASVYLVRCMARRGNELFTKSLDEVSVPYPVAQFIGAEPVPCLVPSNLIHSFNYNAPKEEN